MLIFNHFNAGRKSTEVSFKDKIKRRHQPNLFKLTYKSQNWIQVPVIQTIFFYQKFQYTYNLYLHWSCTQHWTIPKYYAEFHDLHTFHQMAKEL